MQKKKKVIKKFIKFILQKVFRLAFEQMGIISEIVRHLQNGESFEEKSQQAHHLSHKINHDNIIGEEIESEEKKLNANKAEKKNIKLQENCALAIFKCASNKLTRDMVRQAGGLDPLCRLVQNEKVRSNKRLLAAVTGAIWKCAISHENVTRFNQNGLVASLVPLLEENEDDDVLTNVVGALAECCVDPANRHVLRINNGLPKLVKIFKKYHLKFSIFPHIFINISPIFLQLLF